MPNTSILITGYKNEYAFLNGEERIHISKMDIARGFLSIGKTHWIEHIKSPEKTLMDFLHYWTGLGPYFSERPNLVIRPNFSLLDPTDKIQKSYHFGMGVSKIVAEKILKVPYLQHVDSLVKSGAIMITDGTNERGDMVGMDKEKNWHVVEAKGRTNYPSKKDKQKAKLQAEKIATIDGIAPKTKSYCITHINNRYSEIFLHDPDNVPARKVSLEIKENDFVKSYYDKIFGSLYNANVDISISFERQGTSFSLFRIQRGFTSLYLGLENRILKDLRNGNINFFETSLLQDGTLDVYPDLGLPYVSIGTDGIILLRDNLNKFRRSLTNNNYVNSPGFRLRLGE